MGRLCGKELLDRRLQKYKSGTIPLNIHQTEEQIGEKLQFDGASEEREEAIEGDKWYLSRH